ncbi:dipeptide/oligopeptide/nickel ABC transporter permease [Acetobacter malorum DSM 14337]|uniref:Dipeptide/oligopeptide/nickel ABC transporter permease n=1 Tax=Acetobacter malorum DSM 14337 TaxID=1307910 RepID=A0ABQ0PPE9_9PROT|nr:MULTISPECIES: ABC transporter permease [Acetobacter]KXV11075.1 peptide ABC transporter permease [Acetobacter malorum]GBQ77387.1 dipeptide/oligopeptide/nickel ABC transporter permease [Acetobacter malorum DSM 14337]
MIYFFLRRVMEAIPVLALVLLAVFSLTHLIPGDPAVMLLGPDATNLQIMTLRHDLHLDTPLYLQFSTYMLQLLHGDLGTSLRTGRPVADSLRLYLPATAELAVVALLFSLLIGLPLGILSARKPGGIIDRILQLYTLCGVSVPAFLLAFGLQIVFCSWLDWLPVAGRSSAFAPQALTSGFALSGALFHGNVSMLADLGSHIVLPALVLGTFIAATLARFLRNTMLEALSADYILTARAKGLRQTQILLSQAFPNAVGPAIMVLGVQFGDMLGGAILTETVFSWPGVGRYMFEAIRTRDYSAIQSTTLVFAIIFMIVSFGTDVITALIDPRLRNGRSS